MNKGGDRVLMGVRGVYTAKPSMFIRRPPIPLEVLLRRVIAVAVTQDRPMQPIILKDPIPQTPGIDTTIHKH